jgi:phenylacetic acid degradation operon negative regulatory protein
LINDLYDPSTRCEKNASAGPDAIGPACSSGVGPAGEGRSGVPPAHPGDDAAADLPRIQSGANPQHVMASLLGDYWLDRDEHLPSVTLVRLVAEFGVTTASARAALSRLLRRGTLEVSKTGRNTFYRLSGRARGRLTAARADIVASTRPRVGTWTGTWVVVAFSVSEDRREVRHALRSGLRRLGFGPLYDGVWVAPTTDRDALLRHLADLAVEQVTVLESSVLHPTSGDGHPLGVWRLDDLGDGYAAFADHYQSLLDDLTGGRVAPVDALTTRAALIDAWRVLVLDEPRLPPPLLPRGWPRDRAAQVFVRAAEGLAPLAEARFREIVAVEAPALAPLATAQRLPA